MLLTSACLLFYQIRFKQRIISILSQQSADKRSQQLLLHHKSAMSKYWWFFGPTSTRFPSVSSIACMATNPFNHLYCFFHRSDRCHTRVFIPKSRIWTNYNFQSFLVLIVVYSFTFIFNLEAVTFDQLRHFISRLFPYLSSKRVIGWKSVLISKNFWSSKD